MFFVVENFGETNLWQIEDFLNLKVQGVLKDYDVS